VPETATRSRVATPDSAVAVSSGSSLGGGADTVRKIIKRYQSQKTGGFGYTAGVDTLGKEVEQSDFP
jgi:hypothetical protein